MQDELNKLYKTELFRPEEKVVLTTRSCVLLEHFTGRVYHYHMVDFHTLKTTKLFSRKNPLTETGYQKAIEKMLAQVSADEESEWQNQHTRASEWLVHIFYDILPKHGLTLRENQLSLALSMLEAMEKNKIALCEAEVGTGKTYAYLLAAVLYRFSHREKQPIVISTSTIALQKALTEDYLPQISDILLAHHLIPTPFTFVIRKGKGHYACDSRIKTYLSSIKHNNRPEDQKLIEDLTALFIGAFPIDLDELPFTDYVKERICVERCQPNCEFASICRYRTFLRKSTPSEMDFQIVNHNLVLADIFSQKSGRNRFLPESCVLIFDEAHKLLDAARQMYGIELEQGELERLAASIYRVTANHPNKNKIIRLCEELLQENMAFFETLKNSVGVVYDNNCREILLDFKNLVSIKTLIVILKNLSLLLYTKDRDKFHQKRLLLRIDQKQEKLLTLTGEIPSIFWLEGTGITTYQLCSLPKQLDVLFYEDIWSKKSPFILTSATLSVRSDFSHFMHQIGLDQLEENRLLTIKKASPFDYYHHALLYLPKDMPFPDRRSQAYLDAVFTRLIELIQQTHGHTLVLFTSYRMMERIGKKLSAQGLKYPLFLMGKGNLKAIEAFRKSRNGILLASDSAGEGIDLAGDILSSLVVIKLPFPTPDPISEYEKSLYDDFSCYLSDSIFPKMLMKLRQWMGRGIRRETDTCVFSILDSRARERYFPDILSALPNMPVTDQIEEVGQFIVSHKTEEYFRE